jgi:hypothetical protein
MMNLTTILQIEQTIRERQSNVPAAESFIRRTFGEETLGYLQTMKDAVGDRPTITFARQVGKPDLQHNALYLTAKELGFGLATLEWLNDHFTSQNYYKKTYAVMPMVSASGSGALTIHNVKLTDNMDTIEGKRLQEVTVTRKGVSGLKSRMQQVHSKVGSTLEVRDYALPEIHQSLRREIEGRNQIAFNLGVPGESAVRFVCERREQLPEIAALIRQTRTGMEISGPFMYLLNFSMHNLIPNLVLAATDWSHDDQKIQNMYNNTVGTLRQNGMDEPLQTIMPSLTGAVRRSINKATPLSMEVELLVPSRNVAEVSFPMSQDLAGMQLEAAAAIMQQL